MEQMEGASTIERMLLEQAKKMRTPAHGSIELLPLCNMNCDMCYVRLSREEMEKKGRLRTADEWLGVARQMKEAGVLFLLLTGGEPLLYPDFCRLYLELRKLGMILTMNTNGTLIDEKMAAFLGKYKPRRVNVTLYGTDDESYGKLCHYPDGFQKTIQGIRLLRKYGVDVKVGCSLAKANREDLDRILDIGEELDVPVRVDTYMMPATRERELPYKRQSRLDPEEAAAARVHALKREMGTELFAGYVKASVERADVPQMTSDQSRHIACMAGQCSFSVNWQGKLQPCVILDQPAADVFEMGFQSAWEHVVKETDGILLSSKCSSCRIRHLCRTCAASAIFESGSYDGVPEYMCRYAEETLRILQQEWERIQDEQSVSDR